MFRTTATQKLSNQPRTRAAQRKSPERSLSNSRSISPSSGNRPEACFEKIKLPSTITSNWPLLPALISTTSSNRDFRSAARLAARGW